jgi:hypothetical protein
MRQEIHRRWGRRLTPHRLCFRKTQVESATKGCAIRKCKPNTVQKKKNMGVGVGVETWLKW